MGAPLTNWVFDKFGTYKPMFLVCAIVMTIITIVFQFVITASQKDKLAIIENEAA